jgi:hypothetical protein
LTPTGRRPPDAYRPAARTASRLTSRARDHQEQQAEIGALRVHTAAMTVAVMELHGAAAANRLLWEGSAECGRTFLLTVLAFAGGTDDRAGPSWWASGARPSG